MSHTIQPTPQFRRDYRREQLKGRDMGPLQAVIARLASGEALEEENRDRPLTGDMQGYRECTVRSGQILVYRVDEEALVLHLIRTGSRGEVYRREGGSAMGKHGFKTLYRSPVKTAVTLFLLAAAAFLFLYNLGEYAVSDREYREARDRYEGVLTVEEQSAQDLNTPFDFFLLTDDTGRLDNYGVEYYDDYNLTYENCHQQSLGADLIDKLSKLPHISQVEKRYLTAGASTDYTRLNTDKHMTPFCSRAVLTATVQSLFPS